MGERYCCSNCHTHVTVPGTILLRPSTLDLFQGLIVDSVHKSCLLNIELGGVGPLGNTREFHCNSCHGVLGFTFRLDSFVKHFFYQGSIVKHQKDDGNGKAPADTSQSDAAARSAIVEQITQMMNSLSQKVEAGFAKIDAQFNAVEGRFKTINGRLDVVRDDVKNINRRLDGVQHNVKDIDGRLDKFTTREERINENTEAMFDVKEFNFSKLVDSIDVLQQHINVMDGRILDIHTEWVWKC